MISNAPIQTTTTELLGFRGLYSYYRRFIKRFTKIAAPLYLGTTNKNYFQWTETMNKYFLYLKHSIFEPLILAYPEFNIPFIVETEASSYGVGAILSQKDS